MIHPGLVSISFRKLAPAEIIALAQRAGLQGIEWGGDVHVPHGDLDRAREVRQLTREAGLAVSAYGSYYRVGQSEAAGLAFDRVLDTAVALGAPTIRVWAGAVGSAQASASDRVGVVADTRRVAEVAARRRVSVSFEFHRDTLTDTNESALALLAAVNHPNVFTFWQPPHGRDAAYCLAGLRAVLPRLNCIHVFHWGADQSYRLPLADGADRWTRYLELARSTDREHFASLEFVRHDDPAALLEDATVLRRWLTNGSNH